MEGLIAVIIFFFLIWLFVFHFNWVLIGFSIFIVIGIIIVLIDERSARENRRIKEEEKRERERQRRRNIANGYGINGYDYDEFTDEELKLIKTIKSNYRYNFIIHFIFPGSEAIMHCLISYSDSNPGLIVKRDVIENILDKIDGSNGSPMSNPRYFARGYDYRYQNIGRYTGCLNLIAECNIPYYKYKDIIDINKTYNFCYKYRQEQERNQLIDSVRNI